MKVKDIKKFRLDLVKESRIKNLEENFIGYSYPYGHHTDDPDEIRGFFNIYNSAAPMIDNKLDTVLNMAQDSQAIYEFVQNAVDCNSTTFWMFYEDDFFLAINNGDSFNEESIKSILNFAQSTKSNDESIGKFGIGFKLIHRMVGESNGLEELINDYAGPLLFSWNNENQLHELLDCESADQIETDGNNRWGDPDSAWFFKILLTCVPILPYPIENNLRDKEYKLRDKEEIALFKNSEFIDFKKYLKNIWENHQKKFEKENLSSGSIFFMTLGKNKQKRLQEDYENFKQGIQYSLGFIANLLSKKGLETIYLNSEEPLLRSKRDLELEDPITIEKDSTEYKKISQYIGDTENKKYNINIVFAYPIFHPDDKNYFDLKNNPNFYKFFPMGKEKCNLNFIVHSNLFEIDASRREFLQEHELNKIILSKLSEELIIRLSNYQLKDEKKYRNIYLSILSSDIPHPGQVWIQETLYHPLKEYITENVPTLDGSYAPSSDIVIKSTDLNVNMQELGIDNKHWFYWPKYTDYEKIISLGKDSSKLGLAEWNIIDIIKASDLDKCKTWHENLSGKDLSKFYEELTKNWGKEESPEFWNKIVEIPGVIDKVLESDDQNVKRSFLVNVNNILFDLGNLEIIKENYIFKVFTLAKEIYNYDKSVIEEEFRNKVYIISNGEKHSINKINENDRVVFNNINGHKYELKLSDILPEYKGTSGLVRPILEKFEQLNLDINKLLGTGKKIHDKIRKEIPPSAGIENPWQFIFLLLFSIQEEKNYINGYQLDRLSFTDVLDLLFKYNFPLPTEYCHHLNGFAPKEMIYPGKYAIEKECLPDFIKQWIEKDNDDEKFKYLREKGLNDKPSKIVKLRKGFIKSGKLAENFVNSVADSNMGLLKNTVYWLMETGKILEEDSQINLAKDLLSVIFNREGGYNSEIPRLFISDVTEEIKIKYQFRDDVETPYSIDDKKIKELSDLGVSLYQIFNVCENIDESILDKRNYPQEYWAEIDEETCEVNVDHDKIDMEELKNNSYRLNEKFITLWEDKNDLKLQLYPTELPYFITFENEDILNINRGEYYYDDYEFDEDNETYFLTVPHQLSDRQKIDKIIELLKENDFPDDKLNDFKRLEPGSKNRKNYLEDIYVEKLKKTKPYTFEWFKIIFDREHNQSTDQMSNILTFDEIKIHKENKIILNHCNYDTIPDWVEFEENLEIEFYKGSQKIRKHASLIEYKEFELLVELSNESDIFTSLNKDSLTGWKARTIIEGKNVLMNNLQECLFGGNPGLIPQEGNIKDYFNDKISADKINFIFGPPGTGKTTKLARKILYTLYENHLNGVSSRILILTPTNIAADTIIKKIISFISNPSELKNYAKEYKNFDGWDNFIGFIHNLKKKHDVVVRYGRSGSKYLNKYGVCKTSAQIKSIGQDLVLATTIHRLGFNKVAGYDLKSPDIGWNYILIDEASMVSLPHILFALFQFKNLSIPNNNIGLRSPFTISGDPFQILPVAKTPRRDKIYKEIGWATENIYTLLGLDDFEQTETLVGGYKIDRLLIQFRSVPKIGELFSKYCYKGLLKHHKHNNAKNIHINNKYFENINFISFPIFETNEKKDELYTLNEYGEYSTYQIYSAVLAVELSAVLSKNNSTKSISVISPYAIQTRIVKDIVDVFHLHYPDINIDVSTIHRFQGNESDVVLLLMNPPKKDPGELTFFNDRHIVNTGISRAKECLIVIQPCPNPERVNKSQLEILNEITEDPRNLNYQDVELLLNNSTGSQDLKDIVDIKNFKSFNICDVKNMADHSLSYLFYTSKKHVSVNVNLINRDI